MKIMIDATSLARKITGIENYTKNLVENLIRINKPEDELFILFRNEIPKFFKNDNRIIPLVCSVKSQIICEQLWIPYMVIKYKPDLIHFPAFPPSPLIINTNIFFTVHDATMWKYTDTLSIKNKLYMKPLTNLGIKRAKKIITVSNSSKKDLIDVFPSIDGKITNCGISISPNFHPIKDKEQMNNIRKKYKLPSSFLLTVGSLEPRKNLFFLVKAFAKFQNQFKTNLKLVITGRNAWGSDELNQLIKKYDIKNHVIFTGYVPDEDLVVLYNVADYFVFPSIYEGFGLPVLEAMACGTPVIVSNTSSIPEVAGSAALYFSPYNEESLIEQLVYVYENSNSKQELSEKGLKQRKQFSWKIVLNNIYSEYKNL